MYTKLSLFALVAVLSSQALLPTSNDEMHSLSVSQRLKLMLQVSWQKVQQRSQEQDRICNEMEDYILGSPFKRYCDDFFYVSGSKLQDLQTKLKKIDKEASVMCARNSLIEQMLTCISQKGEENPDECLCELVRFVKEQEYESAQEREITEKELKRVVKIIKL